MVRIYIFLVLVILFLFWLGAIFKKRNVFKQTRRKLIEWNDENEELEKLRVVTNQLIKIEQLYQKTEMESDLANVVDLQIEILQMFHENPKQLTENSKRIILYYTNSLLNILQQWLELKQKISTPSLLQKGSERVITVLHKWQELLQNLRLKLLNNQYAVLDAEIQALINGLDLDK